MASLNILAVSGSLHTDSYNRKALQIAKKLAAELGGTVSEIDLRELNLPLYDNDIQTQGLPNGVKKLKSAIANAHMLLIATPEYNYSVPGGLKNAIDWASREGNSFEGKTAAIFGASTGRFGTLRAQLHLREILSHLKMWVLPAPQVMIGDAANAFNTDGTFKDLKAEELLKSLIQKTYEFTVTLNAL